MWRLIKILLILLIILTIVLIAYAYIGPLIFPADFAPPAATINEPVQLNLD